MIRRPRRPRLLVAPITVLLTAIALASAPSPVFATAATDAESVVVELINEDRVEAGLVPLRRNTDLAVVAGSRASKMAAKNVMSHTATGDIGDQLDDQGLVWYGYGEAIGYSAKAWADAAGRDLYRMWMDSPPHRALLMSPKYNYLGVGLALRSSNSRTFGSVVLAESIDENGARAWFVDVEVDGSDLHWSWSGADLPLQTRTAGLRDYDVQYRAGNNPWTTMRNDSTLTTATLWDRTSGVSYALRVRATDRRGNAGAWTEELRATLP